jgi:hypothetical protein
LVKKLKNKNIVNIIQKNMAIIESIPLFVAEEIVGDMTIRIVREIRYVKGSLTTENDLSEIFTFLKNKINSSIVTVNLENPAEFLEVLANMKAMYSRIINIMDILQKHMPRLFIRFFEKIEGLQEQINTNIIHLSENADIVEELDKVYELLETAKLSIISFWDQQPEIFLRLPPKIINDFLSPSLFLKTRYLPYITGAHPLPIWTDPIVIMAMNEAIPIYYTTEQTKQRHDEVSKTLKGRLLEHILLPSDVIQIIVKYVHVDIVFDLLPIQTPFEFSCSEVARKKCENYSHPTLNVIYVP